MTADEEYLLRYWLWRTHNLNHHLYGDDGELQCNECVLDFKRDSVEKIDKKLQQNHVDWLIAHADEIKAISTKEFVK